VEDTSGVGAPPTAVSDGVGDLAPAELERLGRRAIAWVATYLADVERYPVLAQVAPGEIAQKLPLSPPEEPEPLDRILDDFEQTILPGITHWNHPSFFAYFSITGSVPGIIGELLTAALNVNAMLWRTSPSATELELRVTDWLRQMIGLEPGWFGIINDTASSSTMLALASAREAKPELAIRERGLAGRTDLPRLRVYTSAQSHSSVDKAVITLGLGQENVVHIAVDDAFRMRPDDLERRVAEDRARGWLPLATVATVGTTGTTSVDPVPAIAAICRREGMWLHIDGAYGGIGAIVPELREHMAGVDEADSLVVNPHKWMFTPIDVSVLYTRRPDVVKRAFSLVPEVLVTSERTEVVNFMDYGFQLGHRFRALKLWMVIRAFGVDGIRRRLSFHCALAAELAEQVRTAPDWQLMAPVPFSLVCFRYAPAGVADATLDLWNQRILDRVNASGTAYLSHTKLNGRFTLRLAIGNMRTERHHVQDAWAAVQQAALEISEERSG
jgi:aromatic-L-amino-acid/L-tryptophan decarboxylase